MLSLLVLLTAAPAATAATSCDYKRPKLEKLGEGAHPTFSADGKAIIFNSTRGGGAGGQGARPGNTQGALRIYRAPRDPKTGKFKTEGPHVVCLTCKHLRPSGAEGSFDGTAQASPDGRKIIFTSSRDHEPAPASAPGGGIGQDVYVMNADGSDPVRLTITPSHAGTYHPQWSFDGKHILWGRNYNDLKSWELLVARYVSRPRPHLERVVRLTGNDDSRFYEPHGFSPDGRRVIFTAARGNAGNGEIYTMELERGAGGRILRGGRVKQLTDNRYWDEHAHYRHDGSKIAWITSRDHPGAGLGTVMTTSDLLNVPPDYDNYLVVPGVFLLVTAGSLDIHLMDPDGSHDLKVTDEQFAADLDWSPDGCKIVFRNKGSEVGLVKFPRRPGGGCLNSRGGARGRRLGPAVLGRTRTRQRRAFRGKRLRSRRGIDRYCATGGGSFRIGYPTRRLNAGLSRRERARIRRRAVLILTSSRRFSVRRIRRGTSVRRLRRLLRGERRVPVGRNVWYLAAGRSARVVFKTRGRRVLDVGIADRRLTTGGGAQTRFLRAWQLG
jgi:Tol biopolymer transport system component